MRRTTDTGGYGRPAYTYQIEYVDNIKVTIDPVIAGIINSAIIDAQKILLMEQLVVRSSNISNC